MAADNYHAPSGSEANSHPSLSLSLHVDVQDPRISSVGVNSHKSGTVGHVASFWGAEGQMVLFWISHLQSCDKIYNFWYHDAFRVLLKVTDDKSKH